jgi:hypothetical protein
MIMALGLPGIIQGHKNMPAIVAASLYMLRM